ncbi:hypothetical protein E3N88_01568 [Mikania micrantha]|uniref:DNA-directed RNA polymerase n=1 Tax=Mikania micrantha TaxID=192012 RepID=A0A5N6Q1J3_9ASTR|nr:hypothetical protein E3N88_01568 [Mikania micrantha]
MYRSGSGIGAGDDQNVGELGGEESEEKEGAVPSHPKTSLKSPLESISLGFAPISPKICFNPYALLQELNVRLLFLGRGILKIVSEVVPSLPLVNIAPNLCQGFCEATSGLFQLFGAFLNGWCNSLIKDVVLRRMKNAYYVKKLFLLYGKDENEPAKHGEFPLDLIHFVVKGNEKMQENNFHINLVYVAVMLRRMMGSILNEDAMNDKVTIMLIMKAMGMETDLEVAQMLGTDPQYASLLLPSIEEIFKSMNEQFKTVVDKKLSSGPRDKFDISTYLIVTRSSFIGAYGSITKFSPQFKKSRKVGGSWPYNLASVGIGVSRIKHHMKELKVPLMMVIKALDMETDLEAVQMLGRDLQYASILLPSIECRKMSRSGKVKTCLSFWRRTSFTKFIPRHVLVDAMRKLQYVSDFESIYVNEKQSAVVKYLLVPINFSGSNRLNWADSRFLYVLNFGVAGQGFCEATSGLLQLFWYAAPVFVNIESLKGEEYPIMTKEYVSSEFPLDPSRYFVVKGNEQVPIMLVMKAMCMEIDPEVVQMLGRDRHDGSILLPSIKRRKMSRFGKWGMLCPCVTFEGESCGLVKILALQLMKRKTLLFPCIHASVKSSTMKVTIILVMKAVGMATDLEAVQMLGNNLLELYRKLLTLLYEDIFKSMNEQLKTAVDKKLSSGPRDKIDVSIYLMKTCLSFWRRNYSPSSFHIMLNGLILSKHKMPQVMHVRVYISAFLNGWWNSLIVPIMLVIKAIDIETDLEVVQMLGRDPKYASILLPSIEHRKMSRFGKMQENHFQIKCVYVAVLLRCMIGVILNEDAMNDKMVTVYINHLKLLSVGIGVSRIKHHMKELKRIRDLEGQHEDPPEEESETDPVIREARRGHGNRFDHEEQWNPFAEQETRFDPLRALGVKVDIPEFDRKAQPDEFIDWLHTIEAIITWPTPTIIHEARSFHDLASFYRRFIRNFSSIMGPITYCLKGNSFRWTEAATKAFEVLKAMRVLSQEGHPIAFFSKKLSTAKQGYNTYDKEFYAIIRSLENWRHYLLPDEFILFSDHQALRFIQGQNKLNPRHAKWVELL